MSNRKQFLNLPAEEGKVLDFWVRENIFEASLRKNKNGKPFVFYEGPPTANGRPGIHHALTRSFKDVILRYKTMRGFFVERRAGWDTHGLPVEIEVEKELGIRAKADIEKYGIGKFNQKARESVWRYKDEWEKFTRRLGFWLDLEHPYVTYDTRYIESLWWIVKKFWDKGYLYQDFKSVPWCSRCGTGLSSHEVGLGYKKVKDASLYVKLKLKRRPNEFILVWTTTPWTLPANVAVAVNPKIEYTKFRVGKESIWSLRLPSHVSKAQVEVVERISGSRLVGLEYAPLYKVPSEYGSRVKPPFKIFPADFVSATDGTGMVHIAPAFGEDDLNLMREVYRNDNSTSGIFYPILQTVNPDGIMKRGIVGEGKFVKGADADVIEDLKSRDLLVSLESFEHDYPFCWRCGTPLLYFARTCWWVKTTAIKKRLLANNGKINWIPEHIKTGRFGEFLREVRDWAFSRERFWGTPLPIWKCGGCGSTEVFGSRKELATRGALLKNRYFMMRHGEALSNIKGVAGVRRGKYPLTLKGKLEAKKSARALRSENIDLIFSSPVERTRETAKIVSEELGGVSVYFDERLSEVNVGVFEGSENRAYAKFASRLEKFVKRPQGGETLTDLRRRTMGFLGDLEKKYSGKNILLVSHEYPIWMLTTGALGFSNEEAVAVKEDDFIGFAKIMRLEFSDLPRDENWEVNLHRPYVDGFMYGCRRCRGEMRRVSEVADVWFDSGAMPFAQAHWPFDKNQKLEYPADFITEAVDQTRGWFYTLLVIATLLGRGAPYKNVICLGHVLDKNGQKMSKSKGNAVDPKMIMDKYGADTLRWYFYTINSPGEPKRFDEKDLEIKLRSFLMTLWNSFLLFDAYVEGVESPRKRTGSLWGSRKPKAESSAILDKWILTKLDFLVRGVTKNLDAYDMTAAARAIEEFTVTDFSQWFLRRSRRRFQHPESDRVKSEVAETTLYVLFTLTRLVAPFVPFFSETLYQHLRRKAGFSELSIHLTAWPLGGRTSTGSSKVLKDMEKVRQVVAEALRLRSVAGIKVRQPLARLQIKGRRSQIDRPLLDLIKDEVNIKEVIFGEKFELDTKITPELREEGTIRELIRNLQEMRKGAGLKPKHLIRIQISGSEETVGYLQKWSRVVKAETKAKEIRFGGKRGFKIEQDFEIGGSIIWIGLEKV